MKDRPSCIVIFVEKEFGSEIESKLVAIRIQTYCLLVVIQSIDVVTLGLADITQHVVDFACRLDGKRTLSGIESSIGILKVFEAKDCQIVERIV